MCMYACTCVWNIHNACKVNTLHIKWLYHIKGMLDCYNYHITLFKAHILAFSITLPHTVQHFTNTSAVWKS